MAGRPALFAAGLLGRHPGPVLWILGRHDLFPAALLQVGFDPGRLMLVQAHRGALAAMEEGLRHPDLAGVVCELEGRLDLVASRRLQLAAEASDVLGIVLRRSRRFDDPALVAPVRGLEPLAHHRAAVATAAGMHAPEVAGVGRPVWRLELLRCRGAESATWTVEGCDAQGRLALAPVLADRPAAEIAWRRAG